MNRFFAIVTLGTMLAATSAADIATKLAPVPNGLGPNTATYDLVVVISGGDHWTATSMDATVTGGKFLFNATAPGATPNPAVFPLFPSLQWETMFTAPEAWPNTAGQGAAPAFAGPKVLEEQKISATWFDTPPNEGDGTWVVARLSVEVGFGWQLSVGGMNTTVKGQGTLYPYQFYVPEPSTAMPVMAAGAAPAACRRGSAAGLR